MLFLGVTFKRYVWSDFPDACYSEHRPRHPMEILVPTGFGVTHTVHPRLISLHLSSLASSESTAFVASLVLKILLTHPATFRHLESEHIGFRLTLNASRLRDLGAP